MKPSSTAAPAAAGAAGPDRPSVPRASTAAELAAAFWQRMATNDFAHVAELLAGEDFVLEWPQSNERFRGAARFVQVNAEYPAHGPWRFTLHRLVAGASPEQAVTDVGVTDGVQQARVVSFFEGAGGRIRRMVEFWPEPFEPPAWRAGWAEPLAPEAGGDD